MAYVKFNKLPKNIQQRLLERLNAKGDVEGFAFKTSGVFFPYIFTAAALVWFALLFYFANDYLWSSLKVSFFGALSLFAAYLLVQSLYKLFRWFTSPAKSYLLVTPHYVIDINFNDIRYWNLEELLAVKSENKIQNGEYKSTKVTLALEGDSKTFFVKDRETAEQTIEDINYLRKLFIEATVRNDSQYLDSNDDFREIRGENTEPDDARNGKIIPRIIIFAAALLLASGVMFAGVAANNYYDDKKSFELAQNIDRASSYRKYLQTHPQGRWQTDANQKLQALYDAASRKYTDSLNKGYDKKAAAAILEVLNYAKTTQNHRVKVAFERHNEIPADITEQLKKDYEIKNILSFDDTFSDAKMSRRESNLQAVIAEAFGKLIPDDIIEISSDCQSAECVIFPVKYTINSKDSIYWDGREDNVPEDDRTYYPGIFIDWDFGIKIPNQPESYNFKLSSVPAEYFTYKSSLDESSEANKNITEILNADKVNIYDSMTSSAFDDFKNNLIFRMGIGELPKTADVNTETLEELKTPKRLDVKGIK